MNANPDGFNEPEENRLFHVSSPPRYSRWNNLKEAVSHLLPPREDEELASYGTFAVDAPPLGEHPPFDLKVPVFCSLEHSAAGFPPKTGAECLLKLVFYITSPELM